MAKAKKNSDYNSIFATRLRDLISKHETTITEVANNINVTRQAVSAYQDGSSQPTADTLLKIANYFDVSTDYLLGKSDVQTSDITIKGICEYTGLSEKTVEKLSTFAEYNKKYPELDNTLEHLDTFIQSGAISMFKHLDEYLISVRFCKYLELKYPNIDFNSFGGIVINANKNTVTSIDRIQLSDDENEARNDYREELEKNQKVFRYNMKDIFDEFITKYGEYQKEITTTENFEQYIKTHDKSAQAYNEDIKKAFDSAIESVRLVGEQLKKWGITDEVLKNYKKDVDNGNDK